MCVRVVVRPAGGHQHVSSLIQLANAIGDHNPKTAATESYAASTARLTASGRAIARKNPFG